jgi:hypothetical protein
VESHIQVPKPFEVETGIYRSSTTVDKEGRTEFTWLSEKRSIIVGHTSDALGGWSS